MGKLDELIRGNNDNKATVSATVEKAVAVKLDELATQVGCSRSDLVRAILDEGIESTKAKLAQRLPK